MASLAELGVHLFDLLQVAAEVAHEAVQVFADLEQLLGAHSLEELVLVALDLESILQLGVTLVNSSHIFILASSSEILLP